METLEVEHIIQLTQPIQFPDNHSYSWIAVYLDYKCSVIGGLFSTKTGILKSGSMLIYEQLNSFDPDPLPGNDLTSLAIKKQKLIAKKNESYIVSRKRAKKEKQSKLF